MNGFLLPASLEGTAHVVELALTPVFLLSGVATLLNVFAARLARVADRAERVSGERDGAGEAERAALFQRLGRLHRRSLFLDAAVILTTLAGVVTCGAVLTLFVGALREATAAALLFGLFGAAILFTLCALMAFGCERLMASRAGRDRPGARGLRDGKSDG